MNTIKTTLFMAIATAVLAFATIECNKPEISNASKFTLKDALYTTFSNDASGWSLVSCSRYGFGNNVAPQYNFRGEYFNSSNSYQDSNRIDVGSLSNGVYTVPLSVRSNKIYEYDGTMKLSTSNQGLFGQTISIDADGNQTYNVPEFSISHYSPAEIKLTGSFDGTIENEHSKQNNIVLNWNTDANNPSGKVYIILNYLAAKSTHLNSSAPSEVSPLNLEVDDDGSHTILASELADLPTNTYWEVYVGRLNHNSTTVNSKKYYLVSYSYVTQDFKLNQ